MSQVAPKKRRTREEVLAERIANRTTELQRTYDRANAEETRLMLELDRVNDHLRQAQGIMARCQIRAKELGLLHIL